MFLKQEKKMDDFEKKKSKEKNLVLREKYRPFHKTLPRTSACYETDCTCALFVIYLNVYLKTKYCEKCPSFK